MHACWLWGYIRTAVDEGPEHGWKLKLHWIYDIPILVIRLLQVCFPKSKGSHTSLAPVSSIVPPLHTISTRIDWNDETFSSAVLLPSECTEGRKKTMQARNGSACWQFMAEYDACFFWRTMPPNQQMMLHLPKLFFPSHVNSAHLLSFPTAVVDSPEDLVFFPSDTTFLEHFAIAFRLRTLSMRSSALVSARRLQHALSTTRSIRTAVVSDTPTFSKMPTLRSLPSSSSSYPSGFCFRVPDMVGHNRLPLTSTADTLVMVKSLTPNHLKSSMTALGDTILFFTTTHGKQMRNVVKRVLRSAPKRQNTRLMHRLAGTRLLSATTGMGLAALVGREAGSGVTFKLSNLLVSTEGPHRIGIGWLTSLQRYMLSAFMAWCGFLSVGCSLIFYPQFIHWALLSLMVLYSTRPNMNSFVGWVAECAPKVAKKKDKLMDRVRTRMTPILMQVGIGVDSLGWERAAGMLKLPTLKDYGICCLVFMQDYGGYEYVYLGGLGRWCLLGWYHLDDEKENGKEEGMEGAEKLDITQKYRLDVRWYEKI